MILFSDAVFAIVITLMAIEIHLPETPEGFTDASLLRAIFHLIPVILAYSVSFFFMKIFSLLKDYDKGLVIRNLLLLFFIGLFPFSASVVTKANG